MQLLEQGDYYQKVAEGKVVVEFFAPWCEPCKHLQATLEKLESNFDDFVFYKLDTDKNSDIVRRLRVLSIPTIYIYQGGIKVKEINGVWPYENIAAVLARLTD